MVNIMTACVHVGDELSSCNVVLAFSITMLICIYPVKKKSILFPKSAFYYYFYVCIKLFF